MKHVMRNVSGVAVGAFAAWLTLSRRRQREHTKLRQTVRSHSIADSDTRSVRHELVPLNSELRAQLGRQAGELAVARADLKSVEDFLQGDVRAGIAEIRAQGAVLMESLSRDGAAHQARIRGLESAAQRLDDSIAALVSLTRLSQTELLSAEVDLSSIAASVLAQLQERDRRRVVVTNVQDGLRAAGDGDLLRSVMELLLGNAWKRTELTRLATITFTADVQPDGGRVYCVKDNGGGFDVTFAQNLFDNLPPVPASEDFRAAGIGLATVKSIVHRHAGHVWADVGDEGGSRVNFTLGPGPG
ncbi:MAG: sensor signal transduction histidine kinase [Ramlibacter sp.]|nr:sensor signal transduction histidine kinase [Ramlibacter sp.]